MAREKHSRGSALPRGNADEKSEDSCPWAFRPGSNPRPPPSHSIRPAWREGVPLARAPSSPDEDRSPSGARRPRSQSDTPWGKCRDGPRNGLPNNAAACRGTLSHGEHGSPEFFQLARDVGLSQSRHPPFGDCNTKVTLSTSLCKAATYAT